MHYIAMNRVGNLLQSQGFDGRIHCHQASAEQVFRHRRALSSSHEAGSSRYRSVSDCALQSVFVDWKVSCRLQSSRRHADPSKQRVWTQPTPSPSDPLATFRSSLSCSSGFLFGLSPHYFLQSDLLPEFQSAYRQFYLTCWSQFVRLGYVRSATVEISNGVLQGSVLKPIQFVVHTWPSRTYQTTRLCPHVYTDETQILDHWLKLPF